MRHIEVEVKYAKAAVRFDPIGPLFGSCLGIFPTIGCEICSPEHHGWKYRLDQTSFRRSQVSAIEDFFKAAGSRRGLYTNLLIKNAKVEQVVDDARKSQAKLKVEWYLQIVPSFPRPNCPSEESKIRVWSRTILPWNNRVCEQKVDSLYFNERPLYLFFSC